MTGAAHRAEPAGDELLAARALPTLRASWSSFSPASSMRILLSCRRPWPRVAAPARGSGGRLEAVSRSRAPDADKRQQELLPEGGEHHVEAVELDRDVLGRRLAELVGEAGADVDDAGDLGGDRLGGRSASASAATRKPSCEMSSAALMPGSCGTGASLAARASAGRSRFLQDGLELAAHGGGECVGAGRVGEDAAEAVRSRRAR